MDSAMILGDFEAPRTDLRKRMWNAKDDEALIKAVAQCGEGQWKKIAELVPERNPKQCRERWINKLNPNNSRKEWDADEIRLLLALHSQYGNKWSVIAEYFPNRSSISLKNRWKYLKRHLENLHKEGADSPKSHCTVEEVPLRVDFLSFSESFDFQIAADAWE